MTRSLSLTPLQQRRALDALTAAVIVSVALALAGLTWRIAGHAGQGAITVPSGVRPALAAAPDLAPALALAPFGKAARADMAQATALAIELKGIVFAVPQSMASAFVAQNGEAPRAVRVGEAVAGATIEAIQRDRILLNNGGRIEFLAFPDPFASTAASTPAAAASPPATPAQQAAGLLQRFDATPTEGGYAIGGNAPAGLRPGDVIQSLNGQPLGRGEADQAAFANAQASGAAQIQILRDGKPITLTVPLR
ncbi:type II secretion system protein N [Sphingomonas sp.]